MISKIIVNSILILIFISAFFEFGLYKTLILLMLFVFTLYDFMVLLSNSNKIINKRLIELERKNGIVK